MKFLASFLTLAALPIAFLPVHAAESAPMFPFVIPWDDASRGVVTDVSFLNGGPAGARGYVTPKDGHFVLSKTGERIKFLGTNFVAPAAFPSHADAEKVAARVAKLGINLVRLHHMDNDGWGTNGNIWDTAFKDHRHLSAAQLDKLDYLIAQLKKHGVYVNINLHVSRQFTEADGFPASVSQISFGYDKRVDEFDRTMIARQKEYAHDLLTHVNPYTKLSYANDPAVAVVEINNENSLVGDPWATLGADLDTLPEPFQGELMGLWNVWLAKKYATDDRLRAAWMAGVTPHGPQFLTSASPWSPESHDDARLTLSPTSEGAFNPPGVFDGPAPPEAQAVKVEITAADGVGWHAQARIVGLDLRSGDTYTLTFRAKADKDRKLPVGASLDQADWHGVGLYETAALTTEWKTFHYVFTAHDVVPNHVRIAFTLGEQTGTVWIAGLQMHAGVDGGGLQPGQSLASKSVAIPDTFLPAQHDDWIAFLADTERAYAGEMRMYLKHDLKVHANVICSQMGWGGVSSVAREAYMDFADNHAYWQHPSFPHKPWDSVDWNIGNTPMVADLAAGKGGTLRDLAEYRIASKPYSVSEYNHPAPSDYRAETLPEFASFAAAQDWDMIYLFDYGDYGASVQNDKIGGFFGIGNDPAKTAFLPAVALIFRAGTIPPLRSGVALKIPAKDSHTAHIDQLWRADFPALNPYTNRLSISGTQRGNISALASAGTISVSGDEHSALYTAQSEAAQAFAGFVGGQSIRLGDSTLAFLLFGNNFAAGTLTAMDRQPAVRSRKLLLTLVGKVENQDMTWNADRTSVGNHWGHGPTIAEGVPAAVTLKTTIARHVWALDGTGKRIAPVPATYKNGALTFDVGPQYKTLWYEIGE